MRGTEEVKVDVVRSGVGVGHRVVVEVVVRVRVVAVGEGDGSLSWGWGRALVVGRREARRMRLRAERIESRDIVVLDVLLGCRFLGFRVSSLGFFSRYVRWVLNR